MPYFLTLDILYYIVAFLLLITVIWVSRGASSIRLFEQKHLKRLKFVSSLVSISFIIVTLIGAIGFFRSGFENVYSFFGVEWIVLFFSTISVNLGISKIKNTLIHGKKYKSAFFYFGIAFLLMLILIIYLFLKKNDSFIF